jgi:CBS domain-containing protein
MGSKGERSLRVAPYEKGLAMSLSCTIKEILEQKGSMVYYISPEATVFEAIDLMEDKNIGSLLVVGEGNRLVGVFSERDYARRVALKGRSCKETTVREALSGSFVQASPTQTVEECMRLMTNHRVRHLPVLDGDKIVGVVSIGDLVNWLLLAQSTMIDQLETYIAGYPETVT